MNPVGHLKIGAALEDPDIVWTTTECDVRAYISRAREFVEASGRASARRFLRNPAKGFRKGPVGTGARLAASV